MSCATAGCGVKAAETGVLGEILTCAVWQEDRLRTFVSILDNLGQREDVYSLFNWRVHRLHGFEGSKASPQPASC